MLMNIKFEGPVKIHTETRHVKRHLGRKTCFLPTILLWRSVDFEKDSNQQRKFTTHEFLLSLLLTLFFLCICGCCGTLAPDISIDWDYEHFNPFPAPAFKLSGLKVHGHPCKQSIFWLYITSTFNAMRLGQNPSTFQCEEENRKAKEFRISHF